MRKVLVRFGQIRTLEQRMLKLLQCLVVEALKKCFPTNTHFPKLLRKKKAWLHCANKTATWKWRKNLIRHFFCGIFLEGKREMAQKYFYCTWAVFALFLFQLRSNKACLMWTNIWHCNQPHIQLFKSWSWTDKWESSLWEDGWRLSFSQYKKCALPFPTSKQIS